MHAPTADHPTLQELTIDALPQGGRVLVTVRGELDISTDHTLEKTLRDAVKRSIHGVDLDLSGTAFCDCSALNILVTTRRRALEDSKTLTIRSASPAVQRVLTATGTHPLFASQDHDPTHVRRPVQPGLDGRIPGEHALNHEEQELRSEVVQLRRALQTRPVIDQARGILMASFALSPEDAWSVLVSISQNTNTKLHQLADELVTTVQGDALPETMQQHVAAALAALNATTGSPPDGAPPQSPTPDDGGA
jgi:anti-anti-sigma factor